jgi:tyrosyl-tRNA synthetase
MHPKEAKEKLAVLLISRYHSAQAAQDAKSAFEKVFKHKETPQEIPEYKIHKPAKILDILVDSGLLKSKNEARRLIQQNAVTFQDAKILDENFAVSSPGIIKAGSRRFLKVVMRLP